MAIDRRALLGRASKTLAAAMVVPGAEADKHIGKAVAGLVGLTGNGGNGVDAEVALPWSPGGAGHEAAQLARMNLRVRGLRNAARRELRDMQRLDHDIARLTSCSDAYKWHLQARRIIEEKASATLEDWACYEQHNLKRFFAQFGLESFL